MNSVTMIGSRSLFRAGLADLLSAIGFAPIEEADDAGHLFSAAAAPAPSDDRLIIMLARPAARAAATVRDLRSRWPAARVVCLVPVFDLDEMRAQANYARERYQLYKAKSHGLRPTSPERLRELRRASEQADDRLHFAEAEAQRASEPEDPRHT